MPAVLFFQPLDVGSDVILFIFLSAFIVVILYFALKTVEIMYVMRKKRPFFVHFYLFKRKLSIEQESILTQSFSFYSKLSLKERGYFKHRVASFIKDKDFIGRSGLIVTEEMKTLIASTAVMLTFGFRDYFIGMIQTIFIYPDEFFSNMNNDYHKGEFNPKIKAFVISWRHFKKGFDIEDDNLNLGIHEFTHAIHLNSMKERDVSSTIFQDSYKELIQLITQEENLRQELIKTRYFRDYAFNNQYEFIAVIVESFIESPNLLKEKFPQVYNKVKQMLNFNFAGY